ncbi:hypothetical protein D3C76_880950 [compost metagenome]
MSAAISAAISVELVTTLPSCRVIEVKRPPAAGVIAVTCTLSGSGWVITTFDRVWPGAGVAVSVRVRPKLGPVAVSPSGVLRVSLKVMMVGCTTNAAVPAWIRLGSLSGLSRASLPNWKPPLARRLRSGLPSEKLVSARLLRLALICTEITGCWLVTLANGSSMTTS